MSAWSAIVVLFPIIICFSEMYPPYGLFRIFNSWALHAQHTEILFFQPVRFLHTSDFSSWQITTIHFFSENTVFHTFKHIFREKIYPPILTDAHLKIIRDIISVCFNLSFLICTFNLMPIKKTTHSLQTMSGLNSIFRIIFQCF